MGGTTNKFGLTVIMAEISVTETCRKALRFCSKYLVTGRAIQDYHARLYDQCIVKMHGSMTKTTTQSLAELVVWLKRLAKFGRTGGMAETTKTV